ncbi:MAG: NADPH-dependent FMN reductase, partial [Sphingomonas taxi]
PYGESVWAGKPAGIAGVSVGAIGTAAAQQHLRTILAYLDMPTLGQPEMFLKADTVFEESGALREDSREFVDTWLTRFAAWVEQHVAD